jgi:hypothetical protein
VGSAVQWDERKAREVFEAMESDQPLVKEKKGPTVQVAPADISVQVLNGSSVEGLATTASADLDKAGYTIGGAPDNADRDDVTTTVIRYDPEWNTSVKTLQAAFPDATLEEVAGQGSTFQVLVGTEYAKPLKVRVAKKDGLDTTTAADDVCG